MLMHVMTKSTRVCRTVIKQIGMFGNC